MASIITEKELIINEVISKQTCQEIDKWFDHNLIMDYGMLCDLDVSADFVKDYMGDGSVPGGLCDCSYWEIQEIVVTIDRTDKEGLTDIIKKVVPENQLDDIVNQTLNLLKSDIADHFVDSDEFDEDLSIAAEESYYSYCEDYCDDRYPD